MCSSAFRCCKLVSISLIIIALLRMAGGAAYSASTEFFRSENACPVPLEALDFIHNLSQPNLDFIWPCQARTYWVNLQPFVRFVRFLLNNVTPVVIIIGVTLNVVSFVMLCTVTMTDSSLALYLRALALSDNGALVFNYGVGVARAKSSYVNSLYTNSRFLCGFNSVSMEFFQFTSTWLIVCLTWARVAAVMFPLRTRNKFDNHSTITTITVITCVSSVLSLTKLYYSGYEADSVFEFVPCQRKSKPWGNAMYFYIAFSTWLPLLFIFVGNVLLIFHMKKSEIIRNRLTRTSRSHSHTSNRTSKVLLAVSIVHLVLLLPIGMVETLELYWDVILVKRPSINNAENQLYISWLEEKLLLKWWRGLFFHIYHWNFADNFFLYFLAGKTFRVGVIKAFEDITERMNICTTRVFRCNPRSKIPGSSTRSRNSNILLIRVITIGEQSGNVSLHNASDFRDDNE